MIKINNLFKNFGKTKVLSNVSFNIEKGGIYGIIGSSGAGKSTLLRCLNGLETFTDGSISVLDKKIETLNKEEINKLRKKIGMIFQNFNLLNRKDVYGNVELPLLFEKKKDPEKIKKMLQLVGLEDKIHEKIRSLSGGQKQRVAIARALILNPEILLCDEATSALDPRTTKEILALLKKINKEFGITIVMVTHQMEVVKEICERVAFLKDGKILAEGKPEDIFVKPDENIKAFLGETVENLPEGVNIHIFFDSETAGKPVIAMMAREINVEASIIQAKLDNFRGRVLGSLTVNINEEDKEKAFEFLKSKGVKWELV